MPCLPPFDRAESPTLDRAESPTRPAARRNLRRPRLGTGRRIAALGLCCFSLIALHARGHESDFSTLQLQTSGDHIDGVFEIALRDARIAVGLDGDVTGEAGWAGLARARADLRALLSDGLGLATPSGPCPLEVPDDHEARAGGREVARLTFEARCPEPIDRLAIDYQILRDLDPQHRGYFTVEDARTTHVGVFAPGERTIEIDVHRLDRGRVLVDYVREGAWHIFTGWDHLLFLLALLLPAPLLRSGDHWQPRPDLGPTLREVVKIVTAFTAAHSLTLVGVTLGLLSLPLRPVEAAIALSVAVAAWNNLRPFLPGRGFVLAFGFGLIHGFGFADALTRLGLPREARGLALLGFNGGVELGQLAIVAVVLPVLFVLRARPFYVRGVMGVGSLLIAWVAVIWLVERVLGIQLVSGF